MRPPTTSPDGSARGGRCITVSTACASGATAHGARRRSAARRTRRIAVVAGGYDVLCRFVMRGFDALRSLTRDDVRPFDRRRSGLLLGEAAGLVLLRRERDAARAAASARCSATAAPATASHIAAPDPEGRGLERAIRAALARRRGRRPMTSISSAPTAPAPRSTTAIEAAVLRRVLGPRGARRARQLDQGRASGTPWARRRCWRRIMCLLAVAPRPASRRTLGLDEPDPGLRPRPRARRRRARRARGSASAPRSASAAAMPRSCSRARA